MSDSDGEDGRREKSTIATTIITGESGVAGAMGDDCGPAATAMKRRCNDAVAVAARGDSAWTRRDSDAPCDHECGDARVFPAVADYDPTGCGTTDQRVIDAFIRGARAADEDRRKSTLVSTDALAKLYSSAAAMDSQSHLGKESRSCDNTADYTAKRDMFKEELEEAMDFQNLWTKLRQYIRTDFNVALETTHLFDSPHSPRGTFTTNIHDTVTQLCDKDSHQLFMRLVSQAQEFVIEIKIRLFALLHDRSVNLAEIFLTSLLNDYDALVSTAILISELVKPLKKCLNFDLTWDCFIKKLYQIYVYNDALVQNNLPTFIGQLRKLLPLKGSKYQALVRKYLNFDDEMTRIGNLWPETEPWMDKYNAEQAVRMTRLRQIREAWELFTATRKFMERSMLNKTSDIGNEMQEIHGQFSSLIAHTSGSDSPPLSPVLDFNSDSISMPPSIEIVQILLDDWNKAQRQKLVDIAGALTATEVDAAGQGDSNCYDYTRATCQLAQYAIRSVRTHNDVSGDTENGLENGKECECYTCNEIGIDHTDTHKDEKVEKDKINSFASFSNGFSGVSEISDINYTMEKMKEELDSCFGEDKKKKESNMRDTLQKHITSKTPDSEPCLCVYQHAQEIAERKKEILESPPCPCLLNSRRKWDICPCLPKSIPETVVANGRPKATSPTSVTKTNPEPNQKPAVKTGSTQSAQTQTRHSTTQTHNHSMHQGNTHSHAHGPLPDLTKNTGPCSHPRLRPLNHTPHACHKQANVEHIKRMSCNDLSSGDGDCSDSGSSQGDSCSTSSSAQRDANVRHCDCCYCEVFGHGMPSVAPVSRNYKEMRERLRQLLTKKKAKKCKTVVAGCSPQKSPSESSIPNANSEAKAVTNSILRSNTPISTLSMVQYDQRDQRDLEELLEFIEGNQSGKKDNKKAEKKARQKQRKLEEKLKKDRQEAERQKLIELQKKTPEVTITVVDPQKPIPQRLLPQCNLPEVSILPTSPSVSLPTIKQLNNRKKDKQEVCSNSSNNCGSNSITNLSNKTKTASANSNAKNKSINSSEKCEVRNANSSQGSKSNAKNDKVDNNKGNKPLASLNNTCMKNSSNNNANKLSDVDLLDKKLTKKERKKLKKEMKKLEEAKTKENESATHTESQPQIVTIRREINSNSAEPTVTITLKGPTPAEDKVLFTLVNGQTKEPSHKSEQEQTQSNNGKKKKAKAVNNNNNPLQQGNKLQQSNNSKQQTQNKASDGKNLKQQTNNEKSKSGKQADERKVQQQNVNEGKNSKSKKDKRNTENKENVLQQQNTVNKNKNQQNTTNKKQNKASTPPQTPVQTQKQQQNQIISESAIGKKAKKQQQQQQDKNSQSNTSKSNKNNNNNVNNKNVSSKSDSQKSNNVNKTNQTIVSKQRAPTEVQNTSSERVSSPSLSSQFKDIGPNSKIDIGNLKLPPGITITKVDVSPKPLPIKTAPLPKPVNPPKQTTIIATPMSGVQSSYASPQAGGNVIVVDTGKLKQDLLPKVNEKDSQPPSTTTGKKKKKKNKNSANSGNTATTSPVQNNDTFVSDHVVDEPARILHNPGTNMVTIRNPSFGPMKVPPTQQAAIIKVSENGMVTIRSPALQQAINAGLTSSPKPDYIVKGDLLAASRATTTTDCGQLSVKHANGVISSSLAELRSRLSAQTDCASSLSELANIQISQMTNGQPIPENGINLKGTSVTLTKVRPEVTSMEDARQASAKCAAVKEAAMNATSITAANGGGGGSGKSKKKKKRGSGTGQCGDDLDLVEVFTPKDIDLENDEEMDDDERELEAFKRFCLQSVPPLHKEKVNLNIKDIVLKKKSSSSSSTSSSTAAAAAAAAAAVIAAN